MFQQNDNSTLRTAYNIYDSIKDEIGTNKKIFFVQTHIDHRMAELDDKRLYDLIREGKICDNLKMCPKDGRGIREFKDMVLNGPFWDKARTMIQTKYSDNVLKVIVDLQKEKISVLNYKEFLEYYEKIVGSEARILRISSQIYIKEL